MKPTIDYYEILGVPRSATSAEITRNFRVLAKSLHPDSQDARVDLDPAISFSELSEAYDILKDADKRRAYDLSLATALSTALADTEVGRKSTAGAWALGAGALVAALMLSVAFLPGLTGWRQVKDKNQDSLSPKAFENRSAIKVSPAPSAPTLVPVTGLNGDAAAKALPNAKSYPDPISLQAEGKTAVGLPGPEPITAGKERTVEIPVSAVSSKELIDPRTVDSRKVTATTDDGRTGGEANAGFVDATDSATRSGGPQAAVSHPGEAVTHVKPPPAAEPPIPLSALALDVIAIEKQAGTSGEAAAAYRLVSLLASATKEDDLRQAAAKARRPQTIELIKNRIDEIVSPPQTPAAKSIPRERRIVTDCANCPEMLLLNKGTFVMGAAPGRGARAEELPAHRVSISRPFYMSKFKITNEQWRACFQDGSCRPLYMAVAVARPDFAATRVSWNDAQDFVRWLSRKSQRSYRLPSEAEWEYAARYVFSSASPDDNEAAPARVQIAGRFSEMFPYLRRRSSPGKKTDDVALAELTSDFAEWTSDCWHDTYNGAPSNEASWLDSGGGRCSQRVLRGGTLSGDNFNANAARAPETIDIRSPFASIRVVRDVGPFAPERASK